MSSAQPTFDDIWRLFQETDRLIKEVSASQKELSASQKETDRKFKETDLKFKETDRKIEQVTAAIGKLGNRLGDFIEDAVRPSAVRLFRERGIEVHEVHQNISAQRGGEGLEVDLLVVNDRDVVAIEPVSRVNRACIDDDCVDKAESGHVLMPDTTASASGASGRKYLPDLPLTKPPLEETGAG
jgi:hypothetical protein